MTNSITIKNLSKIYPDQMGGWVLKDVDLEVGHGQFLCIVGPSGCGKSTLLKLIAGIEKPTYGQVIKQGNISMVFQYGALFPWLTTIENIAFGLQMTGLTSLKAQKEAEQYLGLMKLKEFKKRYPRELSGGQRQRVGIARALAIKPDVLLLDEPFSALDTLITDELHLDLLKIWQELKMTVIMVSHSLEEAVLLSDEIIIMESGHIRKLLANDLSRPRTVLDIQFRTKLEKVKKIFLEEYLK